MPSEQATPALLNDELESFLSQHPQAREFTMLYTDLCGVARGKLLRREEMAAAYANGRPIPESITALDVTGADVEESGLVFDHGDPDKIARPLPGSLLPSPWAGPEAAQFQVTVTEPDGAPFFTDPRSILEGVVARFEEMKLIPVVAVEMEFYLLDLAAAADSRASPPKPLSGHASPRHLQANLVSDLEDYQPFFRDLYAACEAQGLPARTLLSEYAPGQMELVLQHRADALLACDEAIRLKRAIKGVAAKHGLAASFMAKPYAQYSGSGMHIHASLENAEGANIFTAEDPLGGPELRQAIGGLKATMGDCMAIWAPNANSYRRFRRSSYAPLAACWGANNRTVSLRIPGGPAVGRRLEHRVAGADANPYLVVAAVLAGMHHGLIGKLDPGAPVEGNGYEQEHPVLPGDWFAALAALRNSAFLKDYFGERSLEVFAAIKEGEADRFFAEPTALDFQYYLRTV
ncbi:glutamine synthetase family protein [Limibacillus halophilus]